MQQPYATTRVAKQTKYSLVPMIESDSTKESSGFASFFFVADLEAGTAVPGKKFTYTVWQHAMQSPQKPVEIISQRTVVSIIVPLKWATNMPANIGANDDIWENNA